MLLYLATYLFTILCFVMVWLRWPDLMYLGRDADLSLWLGKAYVDWARPFDVAAMNPMQGMTSMLVAVNPYFNPTSWVFGADLPRCSSGSSRSSPIPSRSRHRPTRSG
jgi:hypothetical protein